MRRFICRYALVWAVLSLLRGQARAADPTTADCLNANEHAIELRNQHKLRAARAELLVCAATTCPDDVRNECMRRVADVNAAMPTIVFEARDPDDNDLSEVAVSMDGQLLYPRLEGTALSIDPGEHDFEFSSQSFPSVHKRLLIREGEKGRREKVLLGTRASASEGPPTAGGTSPLARVRAEPAPQDATSLRDTPGPSRTVKRVIGTGLGVVGIVSLSVALADQLTAKSRDRQSHRAAESPDLPTQATALPLHDQAKRAQTYAIVFGVVGAAALGGGLYLLLTSFGDQPSGESAGPVQRLVPSVGRGSVALNYVSSF